MTQYQEFTLPDASNEAGWYKDGSALSNWIIPQQPNVSTFSAPQWYPEVQQYIPEQHQDWTFQSMSEVDHQAFATTLQWSPEVSQIDVQQLQWPVQAAAEVKHDFALPNWGVSTSTSWEDLCVETGVATTAFDAVTPEMLADFEATLALCGPVDHTSPPFASFLS
jgi:hypothetical protein